MTVLEGKSVVVIILKMKAGMKLKQKSSSWGEPLVENLYSWDITK